MTYFNKGGLIKNPSATQIVEVMNPFGYVGGNRVTHCFICKKPVLGIEGIESILDTFMTGSDQDSAEILASNNYGEYHQACLAGHSSGVRWVQILKNHFERNLRYQLLQETGELTFLTGGGPEHYLLIHSCGPHYALSCDEISPLSASLEDVFIHRKSIQRIVVNQGSDFNNWFYDAILSRESVSLRDVYTNLEIKLPSASSPYYFEGTLMGQDYQPTIKQRQDGFDGNVKIDYFFKVAMG